ncbi:aldehyde dehydrogenase family protein [Mesorhizobium sp. M1217]|uniref:aldehyde dehydrogenase family protein n=1 Tax=Mesorhizobium sp. M1217 TaxID=2957070 RepID=UPI0033368531
MNHDFQLLINGSSRAGSTGQSQPVVNPATGESIGRVAANARRLEAVARLVDDARARGAAVLVGGQRIGNQGFFYAPTVIVDLADDAAMLHEEPFGPLAPIIAFSNEKSMLEKANGLEFGLASYIVTNDVHRQQRFADALEYGVVGVNGPPDAPARGPVGRLEGKRYRHRRRDRDPRSLP